MRRAAVSTIVLLAFMTSAGLAEATAKQHRDHAAPGSDSYIVREVHHQLVMLPYYSIFDDLEYKVNGYNVTLLGSVVRPTLKSEAGNVVKQIEGVQSVTNDIKVLPLSPMDNRIRLAEWRAIYGYPALNRYALQAVGPIHIIVDSGHVTLKGVVASEMDKNMAGIRAQSVSGVFSVKNELQVEQQGK
ncbi:MAG: BON domain-containing protein [Terriglobia bacterium]